MQFESFRGRDVVEALAQVRAAFGANALIGATRVISNGKEGGFEQSFVEVTAAPGMDIVSAAPSPSRSRSLETAAPTRIAPRPQSAPAAKTARAAASTRRPRAAAPPASKVTDKGDGEPIHPELRALCGMVAEMAAVRNPRDRALAMLHIAGVEGSLAEELASGAARAARSGDSTLRTWLRHRIASRLRVAPSPIEKPGPRIVACVGPTGVGKTTTLAKLAAIAHLELGRKVAVVTLDTFRVGAVEQMQRFSELIGVPFEVATDSAAFRQVMRRHGAELLMVDTPSRAPTDDRTLGRLEDCLSAMPGLPVDVLLAVPAAMRARDTDRLLSAYSFCPPTGLVITKLDETEQVGGALHPALEGRLPVAYLSGGARVPEDLSVATIASLLDALLPLDQ